MTAQELLLTIKGDASSAIQAAMALVQSVTQSASQIGQAFTAPSANASAALAKVNDFDFSNLRANVKGVSDEIINAFQNPQQAISALGDKVTELGEKFTELLGTLGPVGEGFGAIVTAAGSIAVVTAGVTAALFELASHAAQAGDEVEAFQMKTGMAVEAIGPLQFAVKAAGGSLNDLQMVLRMVNMREMTDQSGRFAAALKDIGINVDNFKRMAPEQQIMALAKGFQQGAKSGNDMQTALAIMGRFGMTELPMLKRLTDDLVESGKNLGIQWTEVSLKQSRDFQVALNTIETALGNIVTRVGVEVLPVFTQLLESWSKSPDAAADLNSAVESISHGLGYLIMGLGNVTAFVIKMVDAFGTAFTGIKAVLYDYLASNTDVVTGFLRGLQRVNEAVAKIPGMGSTFKAAAAQAASLADVSSRLAFGFHQISDNAVASMNTVNAFGGVADKVSGFTDKLGKALLNTKTAHDDAGAAAGGHAGQLGKLGKQSEATEKAIEALVNSLIGESRQSGIQIEAIRRIIASGQDWIDSEHQNIDVVNKMVDVLNKLHDQHIKIPPDLEAWRQANNRIKDSLDTWGMGIDLMKPRVADLSGYIADQAAKFAEARDQMSWLASETIYFGDVETATGQRLGGTQIGSFSALVKGAAAAVEDLRTDEEKQVDTDNKWRDALKQVRDELNNATDGTNVFVQSLEDVLKKSPQVLVQAFEGGGGFAGAFKALGTKMGSQFVVDFLGKEGEGGFLDTLTSNLGDTLGGIVGSILPGLGGLAGSLLGKLFSIGGPSQAELAGRQAEKAFEDQFGGFQGMMSAIGQAYEQEGLSAQQAQADVKAMLDAEKQGADATNQAIKKIQDNLNKSAADAQAWQQTLTQGAADVTAGFDAVVAGTEAAVTGSYDSIGKAVTDQLTAVQASAADLATWAQGFTQAQAAGFQGTFADYLTQQTQMSRDAATKLSDAYAAQQQAAGGARQSLEDLGTQAVASFTAAVASGMSVSDALNKIGPGLDQLIKSYQDLGLSTDNVALRNLMFQRQLETANPTLAAGVSGLAQEFNALNTMGLMNADTFGSMERTGTDMYTQIQAAVAGMGGTTKDALSMMQNYLQQAQEAAINLGVPLDQNTQMLIDQSKALGIWQDSGQTAAQKLTDAMQKLVDKVGQLITQLQGGLPDAINAIPKNIDVNVNANITANVPDFSATPQDSAPLVAHLGGLIAKGKLKRLHGGTGWFSSDPAVGLDTAPDEQVAVLQTGEAVIQRTAVQALGASVMRAVNSGNAMAVSNALQPQLGTDNPAAPQALNVGQGDMNIQLTLDGQVLTKTVIKNFRYNKNKAYTEARAALGIN